MGDISRVSSVLLTMTFVLLCIAFVVHVLIRDWPETCVRAQACPSWWLVPAAVCAVRRHVLPGVAVGAAIIAVGGTPAGHHRVISAFFVGEAGKYIPGAIWAMLGRSELARREGLRTVDCLLQRGPLGHRLLFGCGPHRPRSGRCCSDRWFHQHALVADCVVAAVGSYRDPSGSQWPDPRAGQPSLEAHVWPLRFRVGGAVYA